MLNHAYDSDGGVVEGLDCRWHGLSRNHVVLKEGEYAYHQLFDGASLLVECAVWSERTHSTASLKAWKTEELLLTEHTTSSHLLSTCRRWLGSQEMWQELLMGNQFQPREAESWVSRWTQTLKEVCHAKQNQKLCLRIETVRMVDCRENVHEHSVVRPLVELCLLGAVIFVKDITNIVENFSHELMLVEVEHLK